MNQFLIDNILLLVIILVCVVTLATPYINRRRFAELDNASATDLINHKGAQIIDLRDPSEFKKECIARSVNIPADRIHYELDKLDKTKPILLVDEDGKRARMASPLLRGVGCKQVYILQGGLNAWRVLPARPLLHEGCVARNAARTRNLHDHARRAAQR